MPVEKREEFESFLESIMELHLGSNRINGNNRTTRTLIHDMYGEHLEAVTCKQSTTYTCNPSIFTSCVMSDYLFRLFAVCKGCSVRYLMDLVLKAEVEATTEEELFLWRLFARAAATLIFQAVSSLEPSEHVSRNHYFFECLFLVM